MISQQAQTILAGANMDIIKTNDQEKTVIITGAAGGMGRACCQHLTSLGWHILAIDNVAERLAQLPKHNITPLCVDLADDALINQVAEALTALPKVWGLVNLAAISKGDDITNLNMADWSTSFAVNVTPAYLLIQHIAPALIANGGGSIVNVTSPVGYIGARKPSYAASKAALHGLTMSCARNLGANNIRVNLLIPGTAITEMTKDWSEEKQAAIAKDTLLKRLCTPEEIAHSVAFLLSEQSSYMTGSILDLSCGGMWGH